MSLIVAPLRWRDEAIELSAQFLPDQFLVAICWLDSSVDAFLGKGMSMAGKTAPNSGLSVAKLALAGLVELLMLAVLGGIAYAAFKYISYGNEATERAAFSTARVVIVSPGHGERFGTGESILVEVSSTGAEPFQTTELWLNGELMSI